MKSITIRLDDDVAAQLDAIVETERTSLQKHVLGLIVMSLQSAPTAQEIRARVEKLNELEKAKYDEHLLTQSEFESSLRGYMARSLDSPAVTKQNR